MNSYLLVVDIGTQSLRASIIDEKGNVLAFSQQKYKEAYFSVEKGYVEQYPEFYMQELCKATKEIYDKDPNYLQNISGMVMVCFRDSSLILDKDKNPIRPAVLWLDQRVTRDPHMSYLKWYEKALFRIIGMNDTVKYNAERTITYWLMKNEKENWAKMKYFVPLPTYFNYYVTGNLVVSAGDCAGHYPFDFKHGKWFSKKHPKQDIFSIPYDALPEIVKVGDAIGEVSEEFARMSFIPKGTKLFATGSDKACETFGDGCVDESYAAVSLGTACTIDVVSSKYMEPETFLPSYIAPYPNAYDMEIQIYRGLWMTRWYLDNFGANDIIESQKLGISPEEYLNRKIQEVPAGCDGLVLQPYWGPGLKRPNAKGSIIGFSGVHTRFHLYRSIYEGIAFALREGMDEILKKTHKKPKFIVLSGGGSASDIFAHIIADVFGYPCYRSFTVEASSLGGAMSGFLSLGVYSSPEEAVENMVKRTEIIQPDMKNHKTYDELYHKVYCKLYPSLKKVYNSCKNFYLDTKEE